MESLCAHFSALVKELVLYIFLNKCLGWVKARGKCVGNKKAILLEH